MNQFTALFALGLKRRSKDFFIIFYSIVYPLVMILLLGYLTSVSYGGEFSSFEYYTIVIIPLIILMAIITVMYAAKDESNAKTAIRFLSTPIHKVSIIVSKLLSCTIVIFLCSMFVLILSAILFKINLGGNFFMLALLLFTETLATTAIGLFLGYLCKNHGVARNYCNIILMIFGFLGGTFVPVGSSNKVFEFMIKLSPLTWINRGIISMLYDQVYRTIIVSTVVLLITTLVFVVLAVKVFKKEAFL